MSKTIAIHYDNNDNYYYYFNFFFINFPWEKDTSQAIAIFPKNNEMQAYESFKPSANWRKLCNFENNTQIKSPTSDH